MTTGIASELPIVGDGTGFEADPRVYVEELQLAFRNHAIPLEGLRYDRTPTGMHYTLIHYDVPAVDAATWRLGVGGHVRAALSLSMAELQRRPARTLRVTLECAGDGRALLQPRPVAQPWLYGAVGSADWTGTPLRGALDDAGIREGAVEVLFTGLDRGLEGGVEQQYQRSLSLDDALRDDVLLAWSMNGAPLEPQHGSPLRLIVPGWYGMTDVKWLTSVEVLTRPFAGYQNSQAYRYGQSREESGQPVTLMRVRSLLVPPGIPDFMTRTRLVQRGQIALRGRAWSGNGVIQRVEVSVNGGNTWADALLDPPGSPFAWQGWHSVWDASTSGAYELCCRATDSAGNRQPLEPFWTARGMGNNAVHRVHVLVE